jgi:hypothetical protein
MVRVGSRFSSAYDVARRRFRFATTVRPTRCAVHGYLGTGLRHGQSILRTAVSSRSNEGQTPLPGCPIRWHRWSRTMSISRDSSTPPCSSQPPACPRLRGRATAPASCAAPWERQRTTTFASAWPQVTRPQSHKFITRSRRRRSDEEILAQIPAARRRARAAKASEPRAKSARYDRARRLVIVELRNGSYFGFPAELGRDCRERRPMNWPRSRSAPPARHFTGSASTRISGCRLSSRGCSGRAPG